MNAMNGTLAGVVVVLLALAGGCEKKENPKPTTPTPPAPDVTPKAGGGGGGGSASASASGSARPTTAAATTAPVVSRTPDDLPALPTTVPAKDKATAAQSKQAQDLVASAITAIQENRLDEARAALDKVDGMGDAIAPTTREQAKTVRANLESVARLQKTDLPLPTEGENK